MCSLEKRGNLFVLTLSGEGHDHRLNPGSISAVLAAIAAVKAQATPGCALLTTAEGSKFFSNGFDLVWARSGPGAASVAAFRERLHVMVAAFRPVVAALLALPLPTVAALPGHAAAAGFLLALSHDYLLLRSDRGVLYMSEIDIGLPFPDYFSAAMRAKIGSAASRREVMLVGKRITGEEAVMMGIAESAHEGAEAVAEAAGKLAEKLAARKWKGEVYAEIRMSMFPELCEVVGLDLGKITTSKL